MTRYLSLYWVFLIHRFKILMEYRVNFFIGASSTFFLQGSSILAIWVVMSQIPSLNGWSFDEVILIYGLVTLAKSRLTRALTPEECQQYLRVAQCPPGT